MAQSFDVVVVGGGPGGYVAAIRAGQLKMKTAVIERDRLGGICLNWGCIPTKALLKNAELVDKLTHGSEWGIKADNISFDFPSMVKRSRNVANRLSSGIDHLMKKNKVTSIYGEGKLLSPSKIEVSKKEGGKETIEAKHIIIATGAHARSLPGAEIDREKIITYKEALVLDKVPEKLTVVGSGAIGSEFAYFYSCMGSEVTLIEYLDTILPVEDKEISKIVHKSFKNRGMKLITSAKVTGVEKKKNGTVTTYEKDGKEHQVEGDLTLMAVGVAGNVEGIGLDKAGVEVEKNHIKVDEFYRTSADGVYAIGDVIGTPWLAHVASHEGIICVDAIAGHKPRPMDYGTIPACTYCQPQVASVGMTEEKCKEEGIEYKVGKFPWSASGRALAVGEPEGLVKMIFDKKYGEILGAHIVGADATELIAEITLAKATEMTQEDIMHTIHAHPTLSETVMEASLAADNMAIHI